MAEISTADDTIKKTITCPEVRNFSHCANYAFQKLSLTLTLMCAHAHTHT